MNLAVLLIVLFVSAILEGLCPTGWLPGQVKIPFILSVVLYYALNRSFGLLMGAALVGGMVTDSLAALPLGCSALAFGVMGMLMRPFRDIVFSGRWVTHVVIGGIAGVGATLITYLVLVLCGTSVRALPGVVVLLKLLGVGLAGMLITPLMFVVPEQLDKMVGNIEEELVR